MNTYRIWWGRLSFGILLGALITSATTIIPRPLFVGPETGRIAGMIAASAAGK